MNVKNSLHKHLDWWKHNVKNSYITGVIENGYKLPLSDFPKPEWLKNNKSARDNAEFVTSEVSSLVKKGIVIELRQQPTVINALTVAINADGKKRLVLDLRQVNPLLNIHKYKYEDIRVASQYFSRDCYMSIFDLKSGYHHVNVHEAYQQFLGFCWNNNFYVFSCCPFGLSASGLIFSKILRELVKLWRARGFPIVMYLDDGIIVGESLQETEYYVYHVRRDLNSAGFVVNEEKSIWQPTKTVKWLGFLLDSSQNIFEVPSTKLGRPKRGIFKNLSYQHACSAREISKTVGKIISLFHAFGNIVYLMSKDSTHWISEKSSWSEKSALPDSVVRELRFWYQNLDKVIRQPLDKGLTRETKIVYSDASSTGCGAFVLNDPDTEMVHHWTQLETKTSSTYRELKTLELFLKIHGAKFCGLAIKWYTDNQAVPSIVVKGSMKQDLNLTALAIFQLCLHNDIDISVDWVPRELNQKADELSKLIDLDDWSINPAIFSYVSNRHGPFSVDRFASNFTHKVDRFYSKYWCDGSTGVDAFAYNWEKEYCWIAPPPKLTGKVLSHMKYCRARGVLMIPKWVSSAWWPLLHDGLNYVSGVKLLVEYRNPKNFFIKSPCGNDMFSAAQFASNVVILRLDFR
jgi:hypothetical protein